MRQNEQAAATPGGPRDAHSGALPYLCVAAAILICYILCAVVWKADEAAIKVCMASGIVLCALYAVIYRKTVDRVIVAILAAGIVMRIGYMLYTPYHMRAHDVASLNDPGHLTYIYNLYQYTRLPQTNDYEFYQPPLQHIAQAAVVKAFSWFRPGKDFMGLVDASKLAPCFASCAVLLVSRRLCQAMNLNGRATAITLAVIAFQPTFFILSASINNDALMLLFFMISVLYTVRWYHDPSMKHMLCIALSIGLATMTKLSGGMAVLFTAPVVLLMLIKIIKQNKAKALLPQFAAAALVCAPLALWYPVRNYILFGQPLNYIVSIGDDSFLYCGDRPVTDRFLSFPLQQVLSPIYCRPGEDCNLWLYTLKCSVFGEYTFKTQPELLAQVLILANLLLILMSLAAMAYVLFRGKEVNGFARYGLAGIWAIQLFTFIVFNVKFPFGCTMDFRYIMPTVIVGAIYLAICCNWILDSHNARWLYGFIIAAVAVFSMASVLFYIY